MGFGQCEPLDGGDDRGWKAIRSVEGRREHEAFGGTSGGSYDGLVPSPSYRGRTQKISFGVHIPTSCLVPRHILHTFF